MLSWLSDKEFAYNPWWAWFPRKVLKEMQTTPEFCLKFGDRSLVGYAACGHKELGQFTLAIKTKQQYFK